MVGLSWLPLHGQGMGPSAHLQAPLKCAEEGCGPGCLDEGRLGTDCWSAAQQE